VTSAAGVWASMIFGFGGMRTDGDVLIFNPSLPSQWNSYRFRVYYQRALLEVRVSRERVEFRVISGPSVMIKVYGENYEIDAKGIIVKLQSVG
jgi:maltose phosphorylase